jgi:tetrahydromethanopterin S-methyltransferase subunit F
MEKDIDKDEEEEEEELQLPQKPNEDYVSNVINEIESQLPSGVNYVTGILVDEDRNLLIIKNGKLYVGKDENNAIEIRKYAENSNPAYLVNALYILKEMIPGYKDFWSGELEKKARKELQDIF